MLIVNGNTVSVNRLYAGKRYKTAQGKAYQELVQWECLRQRVQMVGGKCAVSVRLFVPDARKRDIDNVLKVLLDALTGYAYRDDNDVIELHVSKRIDRKSPRVEIDVTACIE